MKKSFFFKLIIFSFIFFSIGLSSQKLIKTFFSFIYFNYFPYANHYLNIGPEKCLPKEIDSIPKNSILVIGHAYGSQKKSEKRGDRSIAPSIEKLYSLNRNNIDAIIFSGDILHKPTYKKWNKFYSNFDKKLKIYIAPGNHDVGNGSYSELRTIFNNVEHRNQGKKLFPFMVNLNNQLFIIDDSNLEGNSINQIKSLIRDLEDIKDIFVIRHHVLPRSLSFAANRKGVQRYQNDNKLKILSENNPEQNITFIYGDGGAFRSLPRMACKRINNINHLVNGIGELDQDIILIIKNNEIYFKKLDNY